MDSRGAGSLCEPGGAASFARRVEDRRAGWALRGAFGGDAGRAARGTEGRRGVCPSGPSAPSRAVADGVEGRRGEATGGWPVLRVGAAWFADGGEAGVTG